MTRKISDFFFKKPSKKDLEAANLDTKVDEDPKIKGTMKKIRFKIEVESDKNSNYSQSLVKSSENSTEVGNQKSKNKIKLEPQSDLSTNNEDQENVKTEPEHQLTLILPPQKSQNHPIQTKTKENDSKTSKFQCKICQMYLKTFNYLSKHQKTHDKKFQCTICDKKFPVKYLMLKHVKNVHENPKSFKCEICNAGFNQKVSLNKHQILHIKNRPKPFKCDKCGYATDCKHSLKGHLKTHERKVDRCEKCNKVLLFKTKIHQCRLDCKFCGKVFNDSAATSVHVKKVHAQELSTSIYRCDICGGKFYHKHALKFHMNKYHSDGKLHLFICDFDGKSFKKKCLLNEHMSYHLSMVKCDFCHKKVYQNNLKRHIKKVHLKIKTVKKVQQNTVKHEMLECPICLKVLSTKSTLKVHISNHNKLNKCNYCEKKFGTKSKLNCHIKNQHENPKSHVCNICSKAFNIATTLRLHLKTHDPNREKKFKCSLCDYSNDFKNRFEKHLNFHKKKEANIAAIKDPHKCPQCPAVLRSQRILNRHLIVVHPKVIVECDICGKQMKTKFQFLTHIQSVHKFGR
ncbi:hypothetical protein ACKWTF_015104 [Chironomus riparius]